LKDDFKAELKKIKAKCLDMMKDNQQSVDEKIQGFSVQLDKMMANTSSIKLQPVETNQDLAKLSSNTDVFLNNHINDDINNGDINDDDEEEKQ
jgi:hypothetical protein